MISTEDYRFFMDGALDGMVDIITPARRRPRKPTPVLLGDGIRFFGLLLPIPSHVTCAHLRVQATERGLVAACAHPLGQATAWWDAA